jgi:DNA repair protein RecN (Recombination protein N)
VPLRVLRALGAALVDLNGQGAAAALGGDGGGAGAAAAGAGVLALLDARAGCARDASRFGAALVWARAAEAEAASAARRAPASADEAAELAELADDVAAADVAPGEDAALRVRLRALEARRAAGEACGRARDALGGGAADALRSAARELRAVAARLPPPADGEADADADDADAEEEEEEEGAAEAAEALQEALELCAEAEDAAAKAEDAVSRAARALRADAGARDAAAARLRAIEKLCKKHGARDADALLAAAADAADALSGADGFAERAASLAAAAADARAEMATLAVSLTARRVAAARDVERRVDAALASLCMPGARFRVALRWEEAEPEAALPLTLAVPAAADVGRDASLCYVPTASGLDRATLLLSPAPGEPLRPLAATASGGERARVMLALKAAAAAGADGSGISNMSSGAGAGADADVAAAASGASSGPPVSLFDEVDAGVGGTVGAAVGAALRRLAGSGQQVLCVTHLPQVAAFAERHVAVSKAPGADGRPTSRAAALGSRAERAAQLAEMLGLGVDAGEQLLDTAAATVAAQAAAVEEAHAAPQQTAAAAAGR